MAQFGRRRYIICSVSPQERSLRVNAATIGVCIEAATWLLLFWAMRVSPENPEDTLPMWLLPPRSFRASSFSFC